MASPSPAATAHQLGDLEEQLGGCIDELDSFAAEHLAEIDALSRRCLPAIGDPPHPSQDDPVVASVLEQFEKLQRAMANDE